jgi:hypothetical protein
MSERAWRRWLLAWNLAWIAFFALTGAGCATKPETIVRTVEVKVPVVASCVPKTLASAPAYPDSDAALKAAPGAAERYVLLAAGRLLRTQRLSKVEPIIAGCR